MAARETTEIRSTSEVDLMGEGGHLRIFERWGQAFCGAECAWTYISGIRTFSDFVPISLFPRSR